jgi:two-component system nitrate/nitrite response regulator NarL
MGLRGFLAQQKHIEVLGEAADGKEALTKTKQLSPDLVLMDMDLPKLGGLSVAKILDTKKSVTKVLLFSSHIHRQLAQQVAQSGARGFISKQASAAELLQAIEIVAAGATYFSGQEGVNKLTACEREVLVAIVEGLTSKQVALRLGVTVRTVETHREKIMSKLKIRSVAGLTRFAIQEGLTSL